MLTSLTSKHQDKYNVYFLTEFLGGGDPFYAIRAIGVGDSCPLQLHQLDRSCLGQYGKVKLLM